MLKRVRNRLKGESLHSIDVRGQEIFYREIHVDEGEHLPIIIGLHGYGSNERQLETVVPLDIDHPHIYVAPRAFETVENGGFGWHPIEFENGEFQADENAVLSALKRVARFIEQIVEHYQADPERIFVVGYSMGGSMSMMLSLTQPHIARAFAAMAGVYLKEILPKIVPSDELRDKPIFVGHGTLDNLISADVIQDAVALMEDHQM